MNRALVSLSLICFVLLLTARPVRAELPWKLSDLNPFKKQDSPRRDKRVDPSPGSRFFTPHAPARHTSIARASKAPSPVKRFNDGTKKLFSKTKSLFTSWSSPPATGSTNRRFTGRHSSKQLNPTKRGLFDVLRFQKGEPESKPQTPHEFLSQPRPDF